MPASLPAPTSQFCATLTLLLLLLVQTRKLRGLQRAAHLFDRIATLPRQGKISEVELRLYLASQGAGTAEVNKVSRQLLFSCVYAVLTSCQL